MDFLLHTPVTTSINDKNQGQTDKLRRLRDEREPTWQSAGMPLTSCVSAGAAYVV